MSIKVKPPEATTNVANNPATAPELEMSKTAVKASVPSLDSIVSISAPEKAVVKALTDKAVQTIYPLEKTTTSVAEEIISKEVVETAVAGAVTAKAAETVVAGAGAVAAAAASGAEVVTGVGAEAVVAATVKATESGIELATVKATESGIELAIAKGTVSGSLKPLIVTPFETLQVQRLKDPFSLAEKTKGLPMTKKATVIGKEAFKGYGRIQYFAVPTGIILGVTLLGSNAKIKAKLKPLEDRLGPTGVEVLALSGSGALMAASKAPTETVANMIQNGAPGGALGLLTNTGRRKLFQGSAGAMTLAAVQTPLLFKTADYLQAKLNTDPAHKKDSIKTALVAGLVSGVITSVPFLPIANGIRLQRAQTAGSANPPMNLLNTCRKLYNTNGVRGLYAGISNCSVRGAAAGGIIMASLAGVQKLSDAYTRHKQRTIGNFRQKSRTSEAFSEYARRVPIY